METLAMTKCKANCLSLLDEVSHHKKRIVITRYGKPIAEVVPCHDETYVFTRYTAAVGLNPET